MHLQPGSSHVSPSPEPTAPSQREDPAGVIMVPEYFHQVDMNHLTIMIGKSAKLLKKMVLDQKQKQNSRLRFSFLGCPSCIKSNDGSFSRLRK